MSKISYRRPALVRLVIYCLGTSALTGPVLAAVVDYPNGSNNPSPIILTDNTTQLQVLTGSATQSGAISESGGSFGIAKIGAGMLALTGVNTYTGGTMIGAGTLQLSGAGSLSSSGSISVSGAFDISATTAGASIKNLFSLNTASSVVLGNQTLIITSGTANSGNSVFSGTISGSGGVTISGGTSVFAGANTYTGTTTIASGAELDVNNVTTGIAASSNVIANGTLGLASVGGTISSLSGSGSVLGSLTLTNASGTFSGSIGNGGVPSAVTIVGGTETLSGSITFQAFTINAGARANLASLGSFAPANNTLTVNGIFDISSAATGPSVQFLSGSGAILLGSNTLTLNNFGGTGFGSTFSGVISGAGGVTVVGGFGGSGGNRIFAGANTYSGATTIQSGATLQLAAGGSIANSSVADAGRLQLNSSSSVRSLSGSGVVSFGSSTLTLTNAGDTFSGVATGTGGLSLLVGSETLAGANTYSGTTSVNASTLNVTGSIASSSVGVANGATLTGTGKVGTTSVSSGGTLIPGASATPGTLTISGNLTLASGSNFADALTSSAAGLASVSGTASINGNVLANFASGNYASNQQYTLVTAAGGVSGTFSSLATTGLPGNLRGSLSYDANDVYLNLKPNALAPSLAGNTTTNQRNVVAAIDGAVSTGTAVLSGGFNALYNLSGAPLNSAIDQISGQAAPNVSNAVGQSFLSFLAITAQGGAGDTGSFAPGSAYGAAAAPHRAQLGTGETRVWGGAYGGHIGLSADAASGAAALSASNVGLIGGADMQLTDGILAGITLDWGREHFNSGNGSGISTDYAFGLYGRADAGAAYVTAAFGYGWHQITTLRVVTVSGTDVLQGRQNADDFGGRIEAGWRMPLDDGYVIAPYGAFAGEKFESPAYAETALSGASTFALSYAAHASTSGRSELGAHLDRNYDLGNGSLTADVKAAWAHQLDDLPFTQANFVNLPTASFQVLGMRPARDAALLGTDLELQYRSGLFLALKGEGQFGAGTTILEGLGSFGLRW